MKVVRKKCCGLDVHKTLVVATIAATNEEGITSYEQRSFGTLNDMVVRQNVAVIAQYERLRAQGIQTTFDMNKGNHFKNVDMRVAKGINYLVNDK